MWHQGVDKGGKKWGHRDDERGTKNIYPAAAQPTINILAVVEVI